MSERRRWAILACVVVVAAAAAALNATFPQSTPREVAVAPATPASVGSGQAASTAWYCAGPLPVGAQRQAASIAVANLLGRTLRGELNVVRSSGATLSEAVVVPPRAEVVLPLPRSGPKVYAAASVLLDGGGAAVEQIVAEPNGTATSDCANAPASSTYFPAGSTLGASDLTLALFDPSATPAVASVAVSTGSATVSPPAMQDLSVGAGQLVVLNVGHQVPQEQVIGTTVTTDGGELVTGGMLVFARHGGGTTEALTTGTATSAPSWLFGPAPSGPGVREVFAALNPGTSTATVQLRLGAGEGATALQAAVAPGGVVQLDSPVSATASMSWATVSSLRGQPIVVARETVVLPETDVASPARPATHPAASRTGPASSHAASAPVHRTKAPAASTTTEPAHASGGSVTAPLLAAGTSVVLGVPEAASEWVLPGGEADATVGELLVFANPGPEAAVVTVQALGPAPSSALAQRQLHLAAGGEVTWDASSLTSGPDDLAVVATGSCKVLAASFLYARGAAGGLASVAGIPVTT